jgi:hypothetical protein
MEPLYKVVTDGRHALVGELGVDALLPGPPLVHEPEAGVKVERPQCGRPGRPSRPSDQRTQVLDRGSDHGSGGWDASGRPRLRADGSARAP